MFYTLACQIKQVSARCDSYVRPLWAVIEYHKKIDIIIANQQVLARHPLFELIASMLESIYQKKQVQRIVFDQEQLHRLISSNLRHFSIKNLREGYEKAIMLNLSTANVLLVGYTGSGKSLCYYMAALLQSQFTLVVQPLVSVIYYQQTQINSTAMIGHYNAHRYDLFATLRLKSENKLIYTTPQYVINHKQALIEVLRRGQFCRAVFDEAHSVGLDNAAYLDCFSFLTYYLPFTLVTGSPTAIFYTHLHFLCKDFVPIVRVDLAAVLRQREIHFIHYKFSCLAFKNKQTGKTIILSLTVNEAERIATELNVGVFHAKNNAALGNFLSGNINVISCTTAISYGLDSDAQTIIINEIPFSIEILMQSIGRVGRRVDAGGNAYVHFTPEGYLVGLCLVYMSYYSMAQLVARFKLNCAYYAALHTGRELRYIYGYMNSDASRRQNVCFCGVKGCFKRYINTKKALQLYEKAYYSFIDYKDYFCGETDNEALVVAMAAFEFIDLIPPRSIFYGTTIRKLSSYKIKPGIYGYLLIENESSSDEEVTWTGQGIYK